MLKFRIVARCMTCVYLALVPFCNGMSDTPTYVLGTDEAYLQPTLQAIYSLIRSTQGLKRVIVLETSDLYGSEVEEKSFKELCLEDDTQILRWNVDRLKNAIDPDLKSAYDAFCTRMDSRWKFEMVFIRVLFPVLFNREVLEKAGYLKGFNLKSGGQLIDHFIWLDSDIFINKSLLGLYKELSKVPKNKSGIPQPILSVKLDGFALDLEAQLIEISNVSGGVVVWNLDACRKFMDEQRLFKGLSSFYKQSIKDERKYLDETFIDYLLKIWSEEESQFYVADKCFNIRPEDWIDKKFRSDFKKFCDNPNNIALKNQIIRSWMSMDPACPAELLSGFAKEKQSRLLSKVESFLEEVKLHGPLMNQAERNRILDKLSNNKYGKKLTIAPILLSSLIPSAKWPRYQYMADNLVVVHWDQVEKPWNKIALLLLKNKSEITLETFLDLTSKDDYLLDITDIMWLDNLIMWLQADGESGDIKLKRINRINITKIWFNSLIQNQKNNLNQFVKILVSSKKKNPEKSYFNLTGDLCTHIGQKIILSDSADINRIDQEVSDFIGLPVEQWQKHLNNIKKMLEDFDRCFNDDSKRFQQKQEAISAWLDSFKVEEI